jgi:hypothetical protein
MRIPAFLRRVSSGHAACLATVDNERSRLDRGSPSFGAERLSDILVETI